MRGVRTAKNVMRRAALHFGNFAQRAGIFVLPNHYYVPYADRNTLARTRSRWAQRSPMAGIDLDLDHQARYLIDAVLPFQAEYAGNAAYNSAVSAHFGPGYGYIEAQALHGVLRHLRPRRIIEVGSGVSTFCALQAVRKNPTATKIICIEPYPSQPLRNLDDVKIIESGVEDVNLSLFDMLETGDFLFLDSSHAVKPGGDVEFLYLRVLPRLAPGVTIHIHDIFFPFLYSPNILHEIPQWWETGVLQALLTNNPKLSVLCSLSMMHYDRQDVLRRVFPEYVPAQIDSNGLYVSSSGYFPSSIYLMTS